MAIIEVKLTKATPFVQAYNVEVEEGDIILFSSADESDYNVTIKNTMTLFGIKNFVRTIYAESCEKTPPVLAAAKGTEKSYDVHCVETDSFAADPGNSDAPPKIIVHT